jgi:hypothetical protein
MTEYFVISVKLKEKHCSIMDSMVLLSSAIASMIKLYSPKVSKKLIILGQFLT